MEVVSDGMPSAILRNVLHNGMDSVKFKGKSYCDSRVLRRIFGPKRDEVRGECRKLHNEELNDLFG
jgi:hypothetical protein